MSEAQTPTPNNDIRHEAAGNLSFLLSVIRCGEQLSADEEQNVRRVIRELDERSLYAELVAKQVVKLATFAEHISQLEQERDKLASELASAQNELQSIRDILLPLNPEANLVDNIRTFWQAFNEQIGELAEAQKAAEALRARLSECTKMLRRGQKACERQGWEKGESTEAWYHAAGQLAGIIEIHEREAIDAAIAAQEQPK